VDYTVWQLIIVMIAVGMVLLSAFCVLFPQKLINGMPYPVVFKVVGTVYPNFIRLHPSEHFLYFPSLDSMIRALPVGNS
jgi:hypothetical protein